LLNAKAASGIYVLTSEPAQMDAVKVSQTRVEPEFSSTKQLNRTRVQQNGSTELGFNNNSGWDLRT
jgi:hypothetical protein